MTKQQLQSLNIVYIISKDLNSPHIQSLIAQLSKNQIPVQLQTDHDSLSVPLDRRYFVVVDNQNGSIKLSSWFSSLLLFIVGYPKQGTNKKNHYCQTPEMVINKYNQFCKLPEFVKKSYLSSSVVSKSQLKSVLSLRSHSKAPSQSIVSDGKSKKQGEQAPKSICTSINKNSINISNSINDGINKLNLPKLEQKTKLFLYMSIRDNAYNKWLLKIAANNRKKFVLVESLEDLCRAQSLSKAKCNYLVINYLEYRSILDLSMSSLILIMYSKQPINITQLTQSLAVSTVTHNPLQKPPLPHQKQLKQSAVSKINKKQNIIQICTNQEELVNTIRMVGFQVPSLKDIDKSIIKYDNPFTKQPKSVKSNNNIKKIIWNSQSNQIIPDPNTDKHKETDVQIKQIQTNTQRQKSNESISQSNKITSVVRSMSTQSAPINNNHNPAYLPKKRMSIQSNVKRCEEQVKNKPLNEYMNFNNTNSLSSSIQAVAKRRFSNNVESSPMYSTSPVSLFNHHKQKVLRKSQMISQVPQTPFILESATNVPPELSQINRKQSQNSNGNQQNKRMTRKIKVTKIQNNEKRVEKNDDNKKLRSNSEIISSRILRTIKIESKDENNQKQRQKQKYKRETVEPVIHQFSCKSQFQQYEYYRKGTLNSIRSNILLLEQENKSNAMLRNRRTSKRMSKQNMDPAKKLQSLNVNQSQFGVKIKKQVIPIEQKQQIVSSRYDMKQQYLQNQQYQGLDCQWYLLLWKDFNFQIENNKNYIMQQLQSLSSDGTNKLKQQSFCSVTEFMTITSKNKGKSIIILMDEVDMQGYLSCLKDINTSNNRIISVYVFRKNHNSQIAFLNTIKKALQDKDLYAVSGLIKPVLSHQYYDQGLQASKDILSLFSSIKEKAMAKNYRNRSALSHNNNGTPSFFNGTFSNMNYA